MPETTVPSAPETEGHLLGILLQVPDRYYDCYKLRANDFYLDSHRIIFLTIGRMLDAQKAVDCSTVVEELRSMGQVGRVGGAIYVSSLTDGQPKYAVDAYVATILEKSKRRQIMKLADEISTASGASVETADSIAGRWEDGMCRILDESEVDDPHVRSFTVEVLDDIKREKARPAGLLGLSYGVPQLDVLTGGIQPGEMIAIGARSGVGKTSIKIQAAVENARNGVPVHLFSMEMTRKQILRRIYSIVAQVPFFKLKDGRETSDDDMENIDRAAAEVAEWPLRIHDKTELDISQITMIARRSIRKHGTRLIALDYAQIIAGDGRDERTRVANVSRQITSVVKHENCSALLLSQLRKVPAEQYSRPPHIADFRETGQIENDAHVCLLLHRGWNEDKRRIADEGEILVPKQRSGETGAVDVKFNRRFVTFEGR